MEQPNSKPTTVSLVPCLFKYYVAMSLARRQFDEYLKETAIDDDDSDAVKWGIQFLFSKTSIMMSFWYGMLCVVIDGWE